MKSLLALVLMIPIFASAARADSIWDRRDPRSGYLFYDQKARRVGDLVTVTISETTTNSEQDQRTLAKTNSANGAINYAGNSSASSGASAGGTGGSGRTGALNFSLTDSFGKNFSGNAKLTTNRAFTDQMTATVVDILPNGNLVIDVLGVFGFLGEERVLRVTGVIRPEDVGVGNAIPSTAVANFKISYLGRGPATRNSNQNYWGRMMNRLWPW